VRVVRDLDREPGLAAAAGADEGDDPVRREPRGEVAALGVAADEPGAPSRQVDLDAQLVGEGAAQLLEGGERGLLAARRVERAQP